MTDKKIFRFIDLGANIGQSAEWAIETFSEFEDVSLKVDSFEANPDLIQVIKDKNLPNVTVHHKAVDIDNSRKTFYLQDWGSRTGSSLMKFKESVIKQIGFFGRVAVRLPNPAAKEGEDPWHIKDLKYRLNGQKSQANEPLDVFCPMNDIMFHTLLETGRLINEELLYDSVDVECVDIASWITQNVDFEKEFIILKMDIEGTEFNIVTKLLESGLYKKIDALLIEWTPLEKLRYIPEFKGKSEQIEDIIRETHEKFKFSQDWHWPDKCRQPLIDHINSLRSVE